MGNCSVLLAADSFKGSASSTEVENLLELGVRRVVPDCSVLKYPIADGGEGTVDAVMAARGGTLRHVSVRGPLGSAVDAGYALCGDVAIIEMAQASGITLIEQNPHNALNASTYGVGQIILDALDAGAAHICIGLGGSATSDGGAGMAKALGVRFLDGNDQDVPCGLAGLEHLASIDIAGLDPRVAATDFSALTDVSNPLTGPDGAVEVYGPQKGIGAKELHRFDGWMADYAVLLSQVSGRDVTGIPGSGAAGGLGAALAAFLNARISSGIDTVLDMIGLENVMDDVDLVITGEGRMDSQSVNGKAPVGVALRAKRHSVPVIAVVGSRADDLGDVYEQGVDLVLSCVNEPMSLEQCIQKVSTTIPAAAETAMRAFMLGRREKADGA
ncbi:glycerate kinase [Bifidobacterium bohemicum]|uniref:Glycerate kinase n=1 Tax=Bifidobacterium bohemicum DSM 22767 TaxID=1437606 RepID=A0A086ZGW4_9BIFI|nr:glycerate kinase [Bifidobacterium bohemicum]KFI45764.1 glycerate kinase [Bifidobacterium bohemicum DSM 22767]SCC08906.1 glycerate kinase [Bifidobacterium bohemicum]